jgi:hypothetical protein
MYIFEVILIIQGVLDLLANRCLASGTNAWTDTDHTCYTITTAGSDGFLNLMPVYLDHILYPTLTVSRYSIQLMPFVVRFMIFTLISSIRRYADLSCFVS